MNFLGEENLPYKRDFLTYQDLFDVKDRLVEKGLWEEFEDYASHVFCQEFNIVGICDENRGAYTSRLFRPLDEQGNPHFCRLVAEFLEERG